MRLDERLHLLAAVLDDPAHVRDHGALGVDGVRVLRVNLDEAGVRHAELGHHGPRHPRRLLDVAERARVDGLGPEDEHLGRAARDRHLDVGLEARQGLEAAVLAGACSTKPSAPPCGMIVTFSIGSASGSSEATRAWPAS